MKKVKPGTPRGWPETKARPHKTQNCAWFPKDNRRRRLPATRESGSHRIVVGVAVPGVVHLMALDL